MRAVSAAFLGYCVFCGGAIAESDTVSDIVVRFGSGRLGKPDEADRKSLSTKRLRKDASGVLLLRFDHARLVDALSRMTATLRKAGYRDCQIHAVVDRARDGISIQLTVHAGPKSPIELGPRHTGIRATGFGAWPGPREPVKFDDYVRFSVRSRARASILQVQTAVRLLIHPRTRVRVLMVGVVHAGRSDYYRGLERQLDAAEVVLAEGAAHPRDRDKLKWPPDILFMRRGTTAAIRAAALSNQKEWEKRYADDRWQMADLTLKAYIERSKGRESRITDKVRKWVEEMERLAAASESSARQRAREVIVEDLLSSTKDLGPDSDFRETILWNALQRAIQTTKYRSIAVLYGAAHLPRIESKLQQMGFRFYSMSWHDVFAFRAKDR